MSRRPTYDISLWDSHNHTWELRVADCTLWRLRQYLRTYRIRGYDRIAIYVERCGMTDLEWAVCKQH